MSEREPKPGSSRGTTPAPSTSRSVLGQKAASSKSATNVKANGTDDKDSNLDSSKNGSSGSVPLAGKPPTMKASKGGVTPSQPAWKPSSKYGSCSGSVVSTLSARSTESVQSKSRGKGVGLGNVSIKGVETKNLLPSKLSALKAVKLNSSATSRSLGTARSNTSDDKAEQFQRGAVSFRVKSSETEKLSRHAAKLDTVYGLYLQGMMEDLILEKIKKLHKKGSFDKMAIKCARFKHTSTATNRIHANVKVIRYAEDLERIEGLRPIVTDAIDFTGEETLMEIQSILTTKFEKLRVTGAGVRDPIFQENELDGILNLLRTRVVKDDITNVMGWCSTFVEKMKKLDTLSKSTAENIELLEEIARLELEVFSLRACEKAKDKHEQNPNDDEKEEDEEEDGDITLAAKVDETQGDETLKEVVVIPSAKTVIENRPRTQIPLVKESDFIYKSKFKRNK